jgi:hypothetical protein
MTEKLDLKGSLKKWGEKKGIRPTDFAKDMGYTSAYGWAILRGEAEFKVEALGRFVLAYGADATRELLTEAGATRIESVSTLPRPSRKSQIVPVVSITPRKTAA